MFETFLTSNNSFLNHSNIGSSFVVTCSNIDTIFSSWVLELGRGQFTCPRQFHEIISASFLQKRHQCPGVKSEIFLKSITWLNVLLLMGSSVADPIISTCMSSQRKYGLKQFESYCYILFWDIFNVNRVCSLRKATLQTKANKTAEYEWFSC